MDHKLGPYRWSAVLGSVLPLLMLRETAQGQRSFRNAAGTLPMLTATLDQALEGPVTGSFTVWSRNGSLAALHCR